MKLRTILLPILLMSSTGAIAEMLDVYFGAGRWDHSAEGFFSDSTRASDTFDLQQDLHLQDEKEGYAFVKIEHLAPLMPNVRFASTKLSHQGSGFTSKPFVFKGVTYNINDDLTSSVILDSIDLTLYYQMLDNIAALDLGLTLRKVDGEVVIVGTTGTVVESINKTMPLLYVALEMTLTTSFAIQGELQWLDFQNTEYIDLMLKLTYETDYSVGVEVGVRKQNIILNDVSGINSDASFDGPFVGVFLHF